MPTVNIIDPTLPLGVDPANEVDVQADLTAGVFLEYDPFVKTKWADVDPIILHTGEDREVIHGVVTINGGTLTVDVNNLPTVQVFSVALDGSRTIVAGFETPKYVTGVNAAPVVALMAWYTLDTNTYSIVAGNYLVIFTIRARTSNGLKFQTFKPELPVVVQD